MGAGPLALPAPALTNSSLLISSSHGAEPGEFVRLLGGDDNYQLEIGLLPQIKEGGMVIASISYA